MLLDSAGAKLRYLTGLGGYLRHTTSLVEARSVVERELANRDRSFLRLTERGIYGNRRNPLRAILLNAGIDYERLQRLIEQAGLGRALETLYDQGVYITYDEMRGRVPIRRGNLELQTEASDFDNPLLAHQYEMRSTGSSGSVSRSFIDLAVLEYEAAQHALFLAAHDTLQRPVALWRPDALTNALRYTKLGLTPMRWFSQAPVPMSLASLRRQSLLAQTIFTTRIVGRGLPWPRFVPRDSPLAVIEWLAEMRSRGTPALIDLTASAATRLCLAVKDAGADISGTVLRVGGEPFTPAKAAVIASVGARAIEGYAASELGTAGLGCANPTEVDDLHVMTDRLFVFSREKQVDASGARVPALMFTTLLPNSRKIMINADCGDYGRLEDRSCGCLLGEIGFTTHLTGLHGYDKLTSEGVTFMGAELYTLLEEDLPRHFGGHPSDYQLSEEEDSDGLPKVQIVIAPAVGELDEKAVCDFVLQALRRFDSRHRRGELMSEQWRQAQTLSVVRREPFLSGGGRKFLPLHIMRGTSARRED